MTCFCCDRESLLKQVKCLREEKQELERKLENMTHAHAVSTKMIDELQEYVR